jgi:hypothetical protein
LALDLAAQMEQYSQAFLYAVSAAAGFGLSRPVPDTDSVDWTIWAGSELQSRPKLDLQLKATSQDVLRDGHLAFRLSKKNYDDLRADRLMVPRMLLVVVVPQDPSDWMDQSEDALVMSRCGYWMSLKGMPDGGDQASFTVQVPRANQWDGAALAEIMRRIDAGQPLDGGTR